MKGYDEIRGQQFRLVFDAKARRFEMQPVRPPASRPRRKSMACAQDDAQRVTQRAATRRSKPQI